MDQAPPLPSPWTGSLLKQIPDGLVEAYPDTGDYDLVLSAATSNRLGRKQETEGGPASSALPYRHNTSLL